MVDIGVVQTQTAFEMLPKSPIGSQLEAAKTRVKPLLGLFEQILLELKSQSLFKRERSEFGTPKHFFNIHLLSDRQNLNGFLQGLTKVIVFGSSLYRFPVHLESHLETINVK